MDNYQFPPQQKYYYAAMALTLIQTGFLFATFAFSLFIQRGAFLKSAFNLVPVSIGLFAAFGRRGTMLAVWSLLLFVALLMDGIEIASLFIGYPTFADVCRGYTLSDCFYVHNDMFSYLILTVVETGWTVFCIGMGFYFFVEIKAIWMRYGAPAPRFTHNMPPVLQPEPIEVTPPKGCENLYIKWFPTSSNSEKPITMVLPNGKFTIAIPLHPPKTPGDIVIPIQPTVPPVAAPVPPQNAAAAAAAPAESGWQEMQVLERGSAAGVGGTGNGAAPAGSVARSPPGHTPVSPYAPTEQDIERAAMTGTAEPPSVNGWTTQQAWPQQDGAGSNAAPATTTEATTTISTTTTTTAAGEGRVQAGRVAAVPIQNSFMLGTSDVSQPGQSLAAMLLPQVAL